MVEEAVAECVSKPSEGVGLRGEWVVPFSSGSAFARSNDREKDTSPRAPRTKGRCARIVPVSVPPRSLTLRARGAAFGVAFAFYNGSTTTKPAPRGLCDTRPNLGAELPLPLGAAALASCFAYPNGGFGDSHPRARLVRALLVPKVALLAPSGAGRGLKVCSFCRRCVVGASLRLPYFRFAPITRFQRILRE